MDKKKCVLGSETILVLVILAVLAYGYLSFGGGEKITEKVQGNNKKIENTQKKEVSLFHIENLRDNINDLDSEVKSHPILNWGLLLMIFLFIFSFCAHYHCIRMPNKIQKNILKGQQDDKLQECESALVEMGYLRPKPKKQTSKRAKKELKPKQAKRIIKKVQKESKDESDEITEIA